MYELLIVSKISDSDGLLSKIEKTLKDVNAAEVKVEKLGKKVLAYPIKKQTEADYTVFRFSAEGGAVQGLGDMLRLEQETVLRYLITVEKTRKLRRRVTKRVERVEEVPKESKPKVTVVTRGAVKTAKETKRPAEKKTVKKAVKKTSKKK